MEYRIIKNKKHYVYDSVEEMKYHYSKFGSDLPKIKPNWKDANEGDWVISDDDRIVQILKRGKLGNCNYDYVRTIVGTFNTSEKTFMDTDFSQHKNRYTFTKKDYNLYREKMNRKNLSHNERVWVTYMILGKDPIESYKKIFGSKSLATAKKGAAVLLEQRRVKRALAEGIKEIADNLGLTHDWVLSNLKDIAENANGERVRMESILSIGEIIGTVGESKQETQKMIGVFSGFSPKELDEVKKEKHRLLEPENAEEVT